MLRLIKNRKMKRILNIYFILACMSFQSCEDNFEIQKPEFSLIDYQIEEITGKKEIYEDGELVDIIDVPNYKVTFNFNESADVISIYPGEIGNDAKYKDGRVAERTSFDFSFATNVYFGTQDPKTQFFVMASSDYNGMGDMESIHNATWEDITHLFEIPDRLPTNSEYIPSGTVSLMDMLNEKKSLYLAFKYIVNNQLRYGEYTAIRIRNWKLQSTFEYLGDTQESTLNFSLSESEWIKNGRNSIAANLITLRGNTGYNGGNPTEANLPYVTNTTEAWVISDKFSAGDVDLGPDNAIAVKIIGSSTMNSYSYTYTEPGEYDVTFMLSNVNAKNESKIYETVHISIPESGAVNE